jgi:2Fe-2S ferredoxin
MTHITYTEHDGRGVTVDLSAGWSLMQAAIANGVEGIVGECGSACACACATCHCSVEASRLADLPPPSEAELGMLESIAAERRPNRRLACQIKAGPALEGLVLQLPETQE